MSKLFILDRGKNSKLAIKTLNLDGSNIETIFEGEGYADGIAIDSTSKTIYWSNMGMITDGEKAAFGNKDGSINALKYTNGKWVNKVICAGAIYTPKQICFDGGYVYFCDREGLAVYRVSPDGNLEDLLITGDPETQMFDYPRQNVGCVVKDEYLYFTQKGPSKGGIGKILRIKAEPKPPSTIRDDVQVLLDHLPEPIDLMFGPKSGKLYWTDRGAPPNGNSLNCGELQGSKIINHKVITTGFKETIGLVLSPDEALTYVTDLSGQIYVVDNSSGKTKSIYQGKRCTGLELVSRESYL